MGGKALLIATKIFDNADRLCFISVRKTNINSKPVNYTSLFILIHTFYRNYNNNDTDDNIYIDHDHDHDDDYNNDDIK